MGRDPRADAKLKVPRRLGMWAAPFVTISMVVDAGIFASLGPAAEKAGSGLPLAVGVAGLIALATGMSAAKCGAAVPISGGGFIWGRTVGLDRFAFVAGVSFLAKEAVADSVNALLLFTYAQQLAPNLPLHPAAAATVVAATVINYFGLEPTAKVLVVATVLLLVLLGVYLGFTLPAADVSRLTPLAGNGPFGILKGAGTFFFVFAGFQRVAIVASEVKKPERTIPTAILVGFIVSAVYFVLIADGTAALLGTGATAADKVPLFTAAGLTVGRWGEWVVVAAALLATLTTLTAGILGASRVAQAMGAYRELPQKFGEGHGEKKTPRFGVLALGLGTAAITAVFNLRPLLDVANVFILFWYSATNVAAVRLEETKWFAPRAVSWFALAGCVVLVFSQPWWAVLLAAGVGALVFGVRQYLRRRVSR